MFGFLPVFFFFFGIGAGLAILWLLIRYGIPLVMLFFVTIFRILKAWWTAFAEGWNEAGNGERK